MEGIGARLRDFGRCSSAATAIEYALIGTGISIVIVAALLLIGDAVEALFNSIAAAF